MSTPIILITLFFSFLIAGVVVYMLHGIGRIIMYQDKKDEDEYDDYL
jgi:uncharacterized integral membrane protein